MDRTEEWISMSEAVEIASRNHGRQVASGYLRKLASLGKLDTWAIDARTKLYRRDQIQALRIADRPGRQSQEQPSPNALRQRRYKAKHNKKESRVA